MNQVMNLPDGFKNIIKKVKHLPKHVFIIAAGVLIIAAYSWAYVWPQKIAFSYSQKSTCINQITVLPQLHRTVKADDYRISKDDLVRLGNWPIISKKTCFTPTKPPSQGQEIVSSAPFGSLFARNRYLVVSDQLPKANLEALDKPLPLSKPLTIGLDRPDRVFNYELRVHNKSVTCEPTAKALICDVDKIGLKQGKTYGFHFERQFKDDYRHKLDQGELKTLKALKLKKASFKSKQTIFSKPKKFTFTFDKPLSKAEVSLKQRVGKKKIKEIPISTNLEENQLTVKTRKHLSRQKNYKLVIEKAEASDGASLADTITKSFKMSGGPQVKNVSINNSGVDPSAAVYLTFDQQLSESNISKYISLASGSASVTRSSGKQVLVKLNNLPLCRDFTIKVDSGLTSKYGIKSKKAWSHQSRTNCYRTSSIGTSHQGRAITAYSFGNGGSVTLFVGALHGNEVSSSLILRDLIDYLNSNANDVLKDRRVVVIPVINPDGVAAGTRNNSKNVNLNRNFPTDNWERDIDDTNGYVKNGGGKKPLSEPEARALANYSQSIRPRLMLSYHAVGSVVIGDAGGFSASYADRYASMVGYRNATGQSSDIFDYNITGAYEEWTIRKAGIPSIVVELGSYTFRDFNHHREAMLLMLK